MSGTRRLAAGAAVLAALIALAGSAGAVQAQPVPGGHVAALALARAVAGLGRGTPAAVGHDVKECGGAEGLVCSEVDVPLDRTGVFPGTVPLHVEVLPASGTPRGVMFLIAGGPGQGSAHVFGLGDAAADQEYRSMFPGYTLVAYDDRGTGTSGLLDCPALQASTSFAGQAPLVAACANQLGPARDFYTTTDHVEDLEAVRASLGVDKIGLWGTSYGTKLALAYAYAHPTHVERLLLDSVLPTELPDPFEANVLSALPTTLAAFCSNGSCKAATPNYAGDVVSEANALAAKPITGTVIRSNGSTQRVRMGGLELLSMVLDSDLNPGLAAALPAAIHAAKLGRPQAMFRLFSLDSAANAEASIDLSSALYAATVCHDGPFPWGPTTAIADRPAAVAAALAALPPGSLGPFGTWAAGFGNADFCLDWPTPTAGNATLGAGPLPDVPVLEVSGGYDMRTPTSGALSVAARFPQAHVLVVPAIGHSVLGADPSGCSQAATRSWMLGGPVPATCDRPTPIVPDASAYPAPLRKAAGPRATLAIVGATIRDSEAIWLMTAGLSADSTPVPGIFGGRIVPLSARSFRLVNYSVESGVSVSGTLAFTKLGLPLAFGGTLTVGGKLAARGIVGLSGSSLKGTLGGRIVG